MRRLLIAGIMAGALIVPATSSAGTAMPLCSTANYFPVMVNGQSCTTTWPSPFIVASSTTTTDWWHQYATSGYGLLCGYASYSDGLVVKVWHRADPGTNYCRASGTPPGVGHVLNGTGANVRVTFVQG